jgi:hypothetical protein
LRKHAPTMARHDKRGRPTIVTSEAGPGDAAERERRLLLARALLFVRDEQSCRACLRQLDDYVPAQLVGEEYRSRFPDVGVHLDACPECAEAYAAAHHPRSRYTRPSSFCVEARKWGERAASKQRAASARLFSAPHIPEAGRRPHPGSTGTCPHAAGYRAAATGAGWLDNRRSVLQSAGEATGQGASSRCAHAPTGRALALPKARRTRPRRRRNGRRGRGPRPRNSGGVCWLAAAASGTSATEPTSVANPWGSSINRRLANRSKTAMKSASAVCSPAPGRTDTPARTVHVASQPGRRLRDGGSAADDDDHYADQPRSAGRGTAPSCCFWAL